ncbi:MAG: phosphoenolpyruvate--protein phosphotransferase [Pseudomonadota bacterium]
MNDERNGHFNLLCDIGALSDLVAGTTDILEFLNRAVALVACHLEADVGSIYLLDPSADELVLRATVGLNPEAVGVVRMRMGEGLVGKTMETARPVREGRAHLNPAFKYFEEAGEDRFDSFLSVPIRRGAENIGVLVVQKADPEYFSEMDAMALKAIASQMAGAIENARLVMHFARISQPDPVQSMDGDMLFIRGESAAPGFARAPVLIYATAHPPLDVDASLTDYVSGVDGLRRALSETQAQLRHLQSQLTRRLPESAALIFEAHFMILKDPRFTAEIERRIADGEATANAVITVARHYMARFTASAHAYLREKSQDIEDLARRLLRNLKADATSVDTAAVGHIVIARELFPSDILKLAVDQVEGIILVSGGITSHVSIIARSLQIPLVIAHRPELLTLPEGTSVLMDADMGNLYIRPTEKTIRQFEGKDRVARDAVRHAGDTLPETRTTDGHRVHLMANINLLAELDTALQLKAEGVGLYRTEFPFLVRAAFPSEEEQVQVYRKLFDRMERRPVTIRTLDIGGEKVLPYLNSFKENNPELGLRSIRFSLSMPDLFRQQLRAILRAAPPTAELGIMFPMIGSLDDFRAARQAVTDAAMELDREGFLHHPRPALGMMVELPAVVELMDAFAAEVDFFSVGTNDFVQYLLGVDRSNDTVAAYYRADHPAVLRAIHRIAAAAMAAGTPISVCGEMAHDIRFIPFFLGIGIRSLSVDPQFLPAVQKTIANLSLADARSRAHALLAETTLGGMQQLLRQQSVPIG